MEDDSENQIMEATYRAFCRHGYANLSIQRIADEFEKGKSLIYYHFDDKEDLMLSFLDYMMEKAKLEKEDGSPAEQIDSILEKVLGIEDEEQWRFQKAFQEFRVQAQHNVEFQKKFREADEVFLDKVTDIMSEAGSEDPEVAAEIFLSVIEGSISRKVSTGDREGLEKLKGNIKNTMSAFLEEDSCLGTS